MTEIQEILNSDLPPQKQIEALQCRPYNIPKWTGPQGLINEYDPKKHPVNDHSRYPDIVREGGVEKVTRIALDFPRLATKRMTELIFGIPVKRVYKPDNERQKEIAGYMERIFNRTRIDSVNIKRGNLLFSTCEIFTLWYAEPVTNNLYGFQSPLKLRCRTFSPKTGDRLFTLFNETGDMLASSVGYTRMIGTKEVEFFETYTDERHIKWSMATGEWEKVTDEKTGIGKIPGVYLCRFAPIWENQADCVYEMEWTLSRNGNYIRENAKPKFAVFSDEIINYGDEKDPNQEFKTILQLPKGTSAGYITWPQATESIKLHIEQLRNFFFTQLQLPDWSYEKMSQQALSGESRKQLFIDAQMKVKDESGDWIEFFDREVNVVKAFMKRMLPERYHADIDSLEVEIVITPFSITDRKEEVETLMTANGNRPMISQQESIERLGWSDDPRKTAELIRAESAEDALNLSV